MDFPANVMTNVHLINVEEISWVLWTHTNQRAPEHDEDKSGNQPAMTALAYRLREEKFHVYYDSEEQQLWTFNPSTSPDTITPEKTLGLHGLSRLQSGVLNARELYSIGSKGLEAENVPGHVVPPAVAEHNISLSHKMLEVATVYEKAMLAFSVSLSHHLAKSEGWMLLGKASCVNLYALDGQPMGQKWLDPLDTVTTLVKFESSWDATGQLTFSSNLSKLAKLSVLSRKTLILDHVLELGAPVLLSPSATRANYCGMLYEPYQSSSIDLINGLKTECITRMKAEGYSVSLETEWVLVEVEASKNAHQTTISEPAQRFLTMWPADYVFCRAPNKTDKSQVKPNDDSFEIVDPLVKAESWYMDRSSRAKRVATVEKEAELKAQEKPLNHELSDVDIVSEVASPVFRDIIPQDVSGIYPTPPDGLLSQVSETPVSNAQQDTSPAFTGADHGDDAFGHASYNGGANEDLFGEMDLDMVGDADFNFFDEPGMDTQEGHDTMENASSDASLLKVQRDSLQMEFTAESSLAIGSASQDSPVLDMAVESDVKPTVAESETEKAYPVAEDLTVASDVDAPNANSSFMPSLTEQDLDRKGMRGADKSDEHALSNRGSFKSMPLAKMDFDDKYGKQGRYGYSQDELQDFHPSMLRKLYEQQEIPKVGLKDGSTASSNTNEEGDTDEEMTDDGLDEAPRYNINEDLAEMSKSDFRKRKQGLNGSESYPATPTSPDSSYPGANRTAEVHLSPPPAAFFNLTTIGNLPNRDVWYDLRSSDLSKSPFTSDENSFIQIAQLVADQAAFSNPCASISTHLPGESKSTMQVGYPCQDDLNSVVSQVFPSTKSCTLSDLSELDDQESDTSSAIYKLDCVPVCIQRMGKRTDILPSATPFWEELSLGPSSGPKNINAFCFYPKREYLFEPLKTFLAMMKGAYQACKLGRHNLDGPQSKYPFGLFPASTNRGAILDHTEESCTRFGRYLASLRLSGGNSVIYMLNTSDEQSSVPELCSAFLALFEAYQSALEADDFKGPNDLVLQIIPSSMVFSKDKLVMPSPGDYKQLAFQIYDRCGPVTGERPESRSPYVCAPAIRLSKPIPKAVNFKLTPNPPSALLETEDCLHLSYKWEVNHQWLTACWTNNLGTFQWNTAYWLGKDKDIQQVISDVALAMLDTTIDMLPPRRASRKVYIVKDEPFESHEVTAWNVLNTEKATSLDLTLLNLDAAPSLALFPPRAPSTIIEASDLFTTPVSTPYTTGLSPEVSTHISTPGGTAALQGSSNTAFGENDADARLIDMTDETWALVMESGAVDLSQVPVGAKPKPRGYLIKRAGTKDQDGLLPLQVDFIHGSELSQPLLKEVLSMYRNLAMLARVRNLVDPVMGTLPIHVVAARKAHAALCSSMRFEG